MSDSAVPTATSAQPLWGGVARAAAARCRRARWVGIALVLLVAAAFVNGLRAPFVFDDVPSIVTNPTIERLWPLPGPLATPQRGETVTARPVVNLSFALDYALGGRNPAVFRAANIAIHAAAAVLLFGLVRRTLRRPRVATELRAAALPLAAAVALLWSLHPVQTAAVTYVVQRAESLMSVFLLITLFAFAEGTQPGRSRGWFVASWLACLLGMATKEVMVVAPVLVAFYDRFFVAASWREVVQRRWKFHAALALTWLLLGWLVLTAGLNRGGTTANVSALTYWATQPGAIVTYLARAAWPNPLIFDYGARWMKGASDVWPAVLLVVAAVGALVVAWRKQSPLAFLGIVFFVVLTPSSFVPGARQTIAEHRMYLALAPVFGLAAIGVYRAIGARSLAVAIAVALAFGALTVRRNQDYRSVFSVWNDTVQKRPDNRWAHVNVGNTLAEADRPADALSHYETALRIEPTDPIAHYDAANALVQLHRLPEAIAHFQEALRLDPNYTAARNNLADALYQTGRFDEAIAAYTDILRSGKDEAEVHYNLGNVLAHAGRADEAVAELGQALARKPQYPEASYNLGCVYLQTGRPAQAVTQFEATLAAHPDDSAAHNNLGAALAQLGRIDDAVRHVRTAIKLDPTNAGAHGALAQLYEYLGWRDEAVGEYRAVLRLDPQNRAAHDALRNLGAAAGTP